MSYITDAMREYAKKRAKDASSISESDARKLLTDYAHAIQSFNKLADKVAEKLGNPFFNIQGGEEVAYFADDIDFKSDDDIDKWIDELIQMAKDESYRFTTDSKKKNFKFPEVKADDWLTLGPGQDASAFVTFDKKDEPYIKSILQQYGSMIAHVEGDVYLALDGPNDKITSTDGINRLIKENVLRKIPDALGKKYVKKFIELYGE